MRKLAALAIVALLPACQMNPFGSSGSTTTTTEPLPGTAIGSFLVTAVESQNTCGEGALGETPTWSFSVSLSKDGSTIYWDSGSGPVTGIMGADLMSFSFANTIVTDMRPPPDLDPETNTSGWGDIPQMPALPPCSIARADTAIGLLSSSIDPVLSFSGTLSYGYSPTAGSVCTDLITGTSTTPPTFLALPCGISFTITGARE